MENEPITFEACIAQLSSAITFNAKDGGARVMLEIPESEIVAAVKIASLCRNKNLKITFEIQKNGTIGAKDTRPVLPNGEEDPFCD